MSSCPLRKIEFKVKHCLDFCQISSLKYIQVHMKRNLIAYDIFQCIENTNEDIWFKVWYSWLCSLDPTSVHFQVLRIFFLEGAKTYIFIISRLIHRISLWKYKMKPVFGWVARFNFCDCALFSTRHCLFSC